MKIAVVTPVFPPYAGGIGNVAYFNALELGKLGYQVEVFTPLYQPGAVVVPNLTVHRLKPLIKYGNAAFIPALPELLKNFNIIHLHYPFFGGAEVVWFYKRKLRKTGAKIVVHYHMDTVGQGIFKLIFGFSKKFILPKIIKLADKVIVTSLDYAQYSDVSAYLKRDNKKFFELPNGVDIKKFTPTQKDNALLQKYNIDSTDKVVLFVGSLDKAHYFKGVNYLIEAFAKLKQQDYKSKLLIVGKGELVSEYKSLAVQLGLEREVVFAGYISAQDLPAYYNLADVMALPSIDKSEAFGLVLVEAMACGKAVVATNRIGVRSVVEDGVNGYLVEPKNADDLAAKISSLLSDSDLSKKFGEAGRAKTEQKYDWKLLARQLEYLYKTL